MKALALLSGGLDSSLAVKLIQDQGIEVVALKFTSPFCQCDSGNSCHAANLAQKLGIRLITVSKGEDYLDLVRKPAHGYGSGMNPCLDCRIFMLNKAKLIAKEEGAKFMFTGEVLGQRPMSQHRRALELIEKETGLEGKLLRPLSAKLMPETEAEKNGWVDRSALLALNGRSRKPQIKLAAEIGIADYPCPAGGCLLTSKEFALKLRDHLLHHPEELAFHDVALLKVGRHFRVGAYKVIIGGDERENGLLKSLCGDLALLEPLSVPGPTALVDGHDDDVIEMAAAMVARYSDHNGGPVRIKVIADTVREIEKHPAPQEEVERYRLFPSETPIPIL